MQIAADPAADRREYAKKLYKLVAPEGDSQLALFSQFAAGELDKEQLKKRWAEKTLGNQKKINQYFKLYQKVNGTWTAVPGAEYRGMQEDEVKNRIWAKYGREALDSGEYQLVNMSDNQEWEIYDVNTGKTLEIVQDANKGAAADKVFDKYHDQGIGFNVRPWVDPKTLTPRAKLAKRIVDPKQQKPKQATPEIPMDVAQNFDQPQDATELPYNWEFVDRRTGRVVDTMPNATYNQANTWQAAIQRSNPDADISLRSVASLEENFADGKGPGRPGDSQRHGIPKKATMAELEKASHASGRKGQLARWQLNMRRGKKK
jgi:hypothetical protein